MLKFKQKYLLDARPTNFAQNHILTPYKRDLIIKFFIYFLNICITYLNFLLFKHETNNYYKFTYIIFGYSSVLLLLSSI